MNNQMNFDKFRNGCNQSFDNRNFPFMHMDPLNMILPNDANMQNNQLDLATPQEGYIQGNLFNNLYKPYKNYRPMRLVPNNEQARLLLDINQNSFAAHELRLYLDNYPNNKSLIDLFNQYTTMANQGLKEYESRYGAITWDALSAPNSFSWQETPWPWEMEVR